MNPSASDPPPLAGVFRAWALDPARSNDELYTTEALLDHGWDAWCTRHKIPQPYDWPAIKARNDERYLNPAYRPRLAPEKLDATVQLWAEMKSFSNATLGDRPLRDLVALRFFPHLTSVSLDHCEADDLSPLAAMRALTSFHFSEPHQNPRHRLRSLESLRGLPELETVRLSLHTAWPDVSALSSLPKLRSLSFHGNLLILRDAVRLPRLTKASLSPRSGLGTPLRSAHDLPRMPMLRELTIESLASLEGIERFRRLKNLEAQGPFLDLEPLARLPVLTEVNLRGERYRDLAPLAGARRLRRLVLTRATPLDLAPLADLPELRSLRVPDCPALATEVAALQAVLSPWKEDFLLATPRALDPLRFLAFKWDHKQANAAKEREQIEAQRRRKKFFGDDHVQDSAEEEWFRERLQRHLDALLGTAWGVVLTGAHDGQSLITFRRDQDLARLREIIQALREASAECRLARTFLLLVQPGSDPGDDLAMLRIQRGEATLPRDEVFDEAAERAQWNDYFRQQRVRRGLIEREHRLALQQQQGAPINPADFAPPPGHNEPPPSAEEAAAEAERRRRAENALKLGFHFDLGERFAWVSEASREKAAFYYGQALPSWHDQPPRPRRACRASPPPPPPP